MLITALVLTLNFSIFRHTPQQRVVTCGTHTVSYRFVGEPGSAFVYSGTKYVVPASGWIELLAKRAPANYTVSGRALPLDVWPIDEFGTRHVPLPKSINEQTAVAEGGAR